MRKILFMLAATTFIAGAIFTGCNSPSQKLENAEENVIDAKKAVLDAQSDLNQARQDSITEYQQFKIEFENKIIANEKSIEELRTKIVSAGKEDKILYETKLTELQKRNYELKIKLDSYEESGTDQWQSFKLEFKHDMDELGKAFSDFTVSNTK
ncbi:MAG: hypothetical protein JW833_14455 [Prolixibacteraceae bacterium]|nr:hypothetical protein [Prolixibacteraceae bacterium]